MPREKFYYQICVSGSSVGPSIELGRKMAEHVGKEIARRGHTIMTGATWGLSYVAAQAAVAAGGRSIGISPAASQIEHRKVYKLPVDAFSSLLYTGMDYVGRDLFLVQSADAVISIGGRIGTLHEFTSAVEARIPVGVLLGAGGTTDMIPEILKAAGKEESKAIFFATDPVQVVGRICTLLDKLYHGGEHITPPVEA